MSRYAHKTTSRRKIINIREWAEEFNVKPPSISHHLKQYRIKEFGTYNPYDIKSILNFHRYLLKKREERIEALRGGVE